MTYYDEKEKEITLKLREQLATLPVFCKDFFRSIEQRTTARTRLAYAYDLHIFFNFLYEKNPLINESLINLNDLDKITFQDIEEYMEYLKYYNNKVKNNDSSIERINSAEGIKRKLASLRSFYKYYYNNDLIRTNPAAKVSMPRIREKNIIRLENDEVANLLDEVENGKLLTNHQKNYHEKTSVRDVALLSLLLGTGIRVSECVGLNINDLDLNNTSIKIKRKGAKEGIVYFSDEVKIALENYLKQRKSIIDASADPALFLSLQNKRISVRAVEKLVKKYASKVTPLKHITPHKLRSTYGTNLYRETDDLYLVASVLGHSDLNVTRKHYAAMDDDKKRLARNRVKLRND